MRRKSLILMLAILFCASVNVFGGVTNIKEVINETGMTVEIRKYDTKPLGAGMSLKRPKKFRQTAALGAAICGFLGLITVMISMKNIGNFNQRSEPFSGYGRAAILFVTTPARSFVQNAPRVSGESRVDGERRLIISIIGKENRF